MFYYSPGLIKDLDIQRELQRLGQTLAAAENLVYLSPRASAPERPREGMIAYADGVNWDPLGTSTKGPVFYNGTSWTAFP